MEELINKYADSRYYWRIFYSFDDNRNMSEEMIKLYTEFLNKASRTATQLSDYYATVDPDPDSKPFWVDVFEDYLLMCDYLISRNCE